MLKYSSKQIDVLVTALINVKKYLELDDDTLTKALHIDRPELNLLLTQKRKH